MNKHSNNLKKGVSWCACVCVCVQVCVRVCLDYALHIALTNTHYPPACPTWRAAVKLVQSIFVVRKANSLFRVILSQKDQVRVKLKSSSRLTNMFWFCWVQSYVIQNSIQPQVQVMWLKSRPLLIKTNFQ